MYAKQTIHARLLIILLAGTTAAKAIDTTGEIQVGDSAEKVRTALGEPRGSIHAGAYALLQFDRGRVELRDGVVASVDLVSDAEATARRLEQAEQYRAAQERQAELREQRRIEGLDVRDRATENAEFLAASGERQIEFWKNFRRSYPDVPVDAEHAAALARRDADRKKEETERRLAHMEQRVSDAEERARDAEEEAKDARRDARRRYVYYGQSYPVYGYPVVYPIGTNCSAYQPTYPITRYPYSHGYTQWGPGTTVHAATTYVAPTSYSSSGLRVNLRF